MLDWGRPMGYGGMLSNYSMIVLSKRLPFPSRLPRLPPYIPLIKKKSDLQAVANYADATMFKLGRRMGIRSRSALISAVFRKAMVLDMSSANAGQLQVCPCARIVS